MLLNFVLNKIKIKIKKKKKKKQNKNKNKKKIGKIINLIKIEETIG
ncbi:hypothetical protein DOY81_008901 [Sarcophaga bullata]|nr:hypothetical protein DOY81_008901 [Sarcophaga bullata]